MKRFFVFALLAGSSPRLRGTRDSGARSPHFERFIPAPAGNTLVQGNLITLWTVHPRACGEHLRLAIWIMQVIGSSPRLRGTPLDLPVKDRIFRFIPAPAGNTYQKICRGKFAPVHPRACGEHIVFSGQGEFRSGSSPRLRGTLLIFFRFWYIHRFIPAPAGNTLFSFSLK